MTFGGLALAAQRATAQTSLAAVPVEGASISAADLPDAPVPAVASPAAALHEASWAAPRDTAAASSGSPVTARGFPKRLFVDEWGILKSPGSLRTDDLKWLLPLAAATATAFATDHKVQSEIVSQNPAFNQTAYNVSNGLVAVMAATPVAIFADGEIEGDDHARETGILAVQAMVNAYGTGELIKLCTFRERPYADDARGRFWVKSAGENSSFISQHSLVAWSAASVISAEYPNHWVQASTYMAATGVSLTRVLARHHFPSDVLLGGATGWLIGRYVYDHHHYADTLGGSGAAPLMLGALQ